MNTHSVPLVMKIHEIVEQIIADEANIFKEDENVRRVIYRTEVILYFKLESEARLFYQEIVKSEERGDIVRILPPIIKGMNDDWPYFFRYQ